MDWKNKECGTCEFAIEIENMSIVVQPNKERLFECRKTPPQTLLLPVRTPQGQGLRANPTYVKIGERFPACSEYKEVLDKQDNTMQRFDMEKLKKFSLPSDVTSEAENQES